MSAHTPGPWRLMEVGDGGNVHLCPASSDCMSILTVTEEDGIAFAGVFKDGDARLIAAAPDLLEALQAFSEYVHACQCSTDGAVHYSDGHITALAFEARAAIAKATGAT